MTTTQSIPGISRRQVDLSLELRGALGLLAVGLLLWPLGQRPANAYVDTPPTSLGALCDLSTHIIVARIEKFSPEKRVVIYRKVADLKGTCPTNVLKHPLGPLQGPVLQQAEIGKTVIIFFYSYDARDGPTQTLVKSYTYIGKQFYVSWGKWDADVWNCVEDAKPFTQRFCGSPHRLRVAVTEILAGKEVVVPCIVNDDQGRSTIQRLRASSRLLDYNPKRDFVGWGGEDLVRLDGMPGFSYRAALGNLGAGVQGISVVDLEGNGKPHLCLYGMDKLTLLQDTGDAYLERTLPGLTEGCRAAVWADYNGDGKPDLLLTTVHGPKLYTNLGEGKFRDDSHLLPREPGYNLTCAAWIDYDGDGRPDILLGNGFHGLRLYRNLGRAEPTPDQSGKSSAVRWFEDISAQVGLGAEGIG